MVYKAKLYHISYRFRFDPFLASRPQMGSIARIVPGHLPQPKAWNRVFKTERQNTPPLSCGQSE